MGKMGCQLAMSAILETVLESILRIMLCFYALMQSVGLCSALLILEYFFFPQNTLQFLSPGKRSGSYKGEQVELFPSRSTKPIFSLIVLNAGSRSCSEQDRCWVWFTLQPEPGQGIRRSRRSRRTRLRASTELPQVKIITQPPPSVLQTTCWCPSAGCCG